MSRRRRALLLLGLALVLGGLAASDVARREAAIDRRVGPMVPVVVARRALAPGTRVAADAVALRQVPSRFAPAGAFASVADVAGLRAAVGVPAGGDLSSGQLVGADAGRPGRGPIDPGQRVAEVVAQGAPSLVRPGSHVDVLVTRGSRDGSSGHTELALQDVEVVAVAPAPADATGEGAGPRVAVSLLVTLRQAVYLAAAQDFARELRVLPRAAGDRGRTGALSFDGGD